MSVGEKVNLKITVFVFACAISFIGCETHTTSSTSAISETAAPKKENIDCPYKNVQIITGDFIEDSRFIGSKARLRQEQLARELSKHLNKVGFKVVYETESANWVLFSNAVEVNDEPIFWSLLMQKLPTITDDGTLLFRPFNIVTKSGRPFKFTSTSFLIVTEPTKLDNIMVQISNDLASKWLPSIQEQCNNMSAALLKQGEELEKIRELLVDEINRIEKLRLEQEKHLDLEVEPQAGKSQEVSVYCTVGRGALCGHEHQPVCALGRDRRWRTHNNACRACADTFVLGYRPGRCQ
jgi:hypothetical protein